MRREKCRMFNLFKRKKKEKSEMELFEEELAVSLESVITDAECKTCSNLIISGGKISSCACKEGKFNYAKYPPVELSEQCDGSSYVPKTKSHNLLTHI